MDFSTLPFVAKDSAAAAVDPTIYGNLSAWWDAANLGYADATPIDDSTKKFTDRSSNALHAIQATAGSRPLYKTNIVNGKGVVRFDGSDDFLSFTRTASIAGDYTIIWIGTQASGTTGIILGDSVTNYQALRNISGTNKFSQYWNASVSSSNTLSGASNVVHMGSWRRSGTNIYHRENKTDRSAGLSDGSGFTLDRMGVYAFGNNASGDFCDLVLYTAYRTDAEVDNLYDNYFKAKWGLP